MSILMEW